METIDYPHFLKLWLENKHYEQDAHVPQTVGFQISWVNGTESKLSGERRVTRTKGQPLCWWQSVQLISGLPYSDTQIKTENDPSIYEFGKM